MSNSVQADISRILKDYVDDAREIIEDSAKEAAEICTRQLKSTSPKRRGGGKHYANGWAIKSETDKRVASFIVYNKSKPQLTHLLENGHVIRNKKGTFGRAPAIKHIKPAEESCIMKFELRVRARLRSMR